MAIPFDILRTPQTYNSLRKENLENRMSELKNQYYAPSILSEINNRNASTNKLNTMTPLEAKELEIKNQFAPQREAANINSLNAGTNKTNTMLPYEAEEARVNNLTRGRKNLADVTSTELANKKAETMNPLEVEEQLIKNKNLDAKEKADIAYKNAGGGRAGVKSANRIAYANSVEKDNPQLGGDPEKLREAADVLSEGGDTLSTGEKLNPMSIFTKNALAAMNMGATTAAVTTQNIKAIQADAELGTLAKYANDYIGPYGTTYAGYSPQQVMDSVKSDEKSQKQLGRFIAGNALQYEIAQIRNRIAGGEPGITATQELMAKSGQVIKTHFPKLSGVARQEAQRALDEALQKGLKARLKAGTSAASLSTFANSKEEPTTEQNDKKVIKVVEDASGNYVVENK